MRAERGLRVEAHCEHQRRVQLTQRERIERAASPDEAILRDVDDPVAVRDARLAHAVRRRQVDLGDVTAYRARHNYAGETAQDRDRGLTGRYHDRPDRGPEISVPDVAACDHDIASPASAAAASSTRVSSEVSGVAAYAAR